MNNLQKADKYTNQILKVIENIEELSTSDLQGIIEAIVLNIINEKE